MTDPAVRLLRELRSHTRNYIAELEAGLSALTPELVEGKPELTYIRSMLRVAAGAVGSGHAFGTPRNIEYSLTRALGESGEATT